jgi:hypothetical protein
MKNKSPSNTIINAIVLIVAILGIFLLGNFIVTVFQDPEETTDEELSMYKLQQERASVPIVPKE